MTASVIDSRLDELLAQSKLVICVGSGGVGKTTTAAALALQAACEGRQVLVITIDPARRLANALGLDAIGNQETAIDPMLLAEAGAESTGRLFAMMLDTRTTFDELIARVAPDEGTRERILKNNIYQQISSAISTAQDVMAIEKLFDVYSQGRYDLIVLDTPPMKNALDFLEAPNRMTRFLDDKIIKWFIKAPPSGPLSLGHRLMQSTGAVAYKLLSYIFGNEFLADLNEFFVNFKDMTLGFRIRSEKVAEILRGKTTSFVIVCGPGTTSVEDARHFASQLRERQLKAGGLIVNQVRSWKERPFSDDSVLSPEERDWMATGWREVVGEGIGSALALQSALLDRLERHYRWSFERSVQDQRAVTELRRLLGVGTSFSVVPRLFEEISDIPGLLKLNSHLFALKVH